MVDEIKEFNPKNFKVGVWYYAVTGLSGWPEWPAVCSEYECEYLVLGHMGIPEAFKVVRIRT